MSRLCVWIVVVFVALFRSSQSQMQGAACKLKCRATSHVAFRKTVEGNELSRFTSNGCGTASFRVDVEEQLTPCCDIHDACYALCGVERDRCDSDFATCLGKACNGKKSCLQSVGMLTSGVSMFGCSAFMATQKDNCECIADRAEAEKRADAVMNAVLIHTKKTSPDLVDTVARSTRKADGLASKVSAVRKLLAKLNATIITRDNQRQEL